MTKSEFAKPVAIDHLSYSNIADSLTVPYMKDDKVEISQKRYECVKGSCLRENILTILTFVAVVIGVGTGFGLRGLRTWTQREVTYISFLGEIFLRMLRCLILPLIVSSLISALGSLDAKLSGKIGIRAVVYYMSTTILAIILGIVLVSAIRPGSGESFNSNSKNPLTKPMLTADALLDLVRNMFPTNLVEACFSQYGTVLIPPKNLVEATNFTNHSIALDPHGNLTDIKLPENLTETTNFTNVSTDYSTWDLKGEMGGSTNFLGLVVFSVVFGITLGRMGSKGKPLINMFIALSDAMMIITRLVIWFSPIGILFLVVGKILSMDNLAQVAAQVGLYTITVLAGVLLHGLVVLPLLYFIIIRKQPFTFIANMTQAIATAFGTASSSASLPITISCIEDKNGIDPRVSRFCLPVGATINMDGTALYEAVAAIFIAQVRRVPLTAGNIISISITATAASIGAAGIPQAGLVTMVMVLNTIGLPAEDVTLILVVDWLLDRFRTAINVLGDAFGAAIVAHLSANDLEKLSAEDELTEGSKSESTLL